MGNCLSKLRYELDSTEKTQVLVTIITDGYENASREYSLRMIHNLVKDLKAQGWVFAYIGANQDVDKVAKSFDIDNKMSFEADDEGSRFMAQKLNVSRTAFYDKLSKSLHDVTVNLKERFFEDDEV